jgi:hypothetical protein
VKQRSLFAGDLLVTGAVENDVVEDDADAIVDDVDDVAIVADATD